MANLDDILVKRSGQSKAKNAELIGGGNWSWDLGSELLSWTADAYIQIIGLVDTYNTIQTANATIQSGEVAYVKALPDATGVNNLTVVVAAISAVPDEAGIYIIARRDGDTIVVDDEYRIADGQSLELGQSLFNPFWEQLKMTVPNTNEVAIAAADFDFDGNTLSQSLGTKIMQFPGSTIDFTLGSATGGINIEGLGGVTTDIPVDTEYLWYSMAFEEDSVNADNSATPKILFTPALSTGASAGAAPLPDLTGTKKFGAVLIQRVGTDAVVTTIRRLGAGSGDGSGTGTGGGTGSGGAETPFETYNILISDSMQEEAGTGSSTIDATNTNSSYDSEGQYHDLLIEAVTPTTNSGTTFDISVAPGFVAAIGDVIITDNDDGEFRKIVGKTSDTQYTLDAAFTSAVTTGNFFISQAVWTKNLPLDTGDAGESTRPIDYYPAENIGQVMLNYQDSYITDDVTPDINESARILAAVTSDSAATTNSYSSIYARPLASEELTDLGLPASDQDLIVVFFPNYADPSIISNGSAALLSYQISFYNDPSVLNGGILENAYTMTASGTPINCSAPYDVAGKTRIDLDWTYVQGIASGDPVGQLTALVNGQAIPRYVAGVTNDAYYKEITPFTLEFWDDITVSDVSIQIIKMEGSIVVDDLVAANFQLLTTTNKATVSTNLSRYVYQRWAADSTTAGFTITLPATPLEGDRVEIFDPLGTWNTNNVTVDGNGNLIEGNATELLDVDKQSVIFEYYSAAAGWIVLL